MFYSYPASAIADNWLHDVVCSILQSVHACVAAGEEVPDWNRLLPDAYRERLRRYSNLKDGVFEYASALEVLTPTERESVSRAMSEQNRVAELLSNTCDCSVLADLPERIQSPIRRLYEAAFKALTGLGIRDQHYYKIYHATKYHVCPFCGCEKFDAPGRPREALDHYLAESKYPFAAANLRNLDPMGNKCNSRYKLAQDVLRRGAVRRKAIDPYNHGGYSIALDRSVPFAGLNDEHPRWIIDLIPDVEEAETWDDVFNIKVRLSENELDEGFRRWLDEYRAWCASARFMPVNYEELSDALERYSRYQEDIGLSELGFLKAAVFYMLLRRCVEGDGRLIELLLDLTR